MIRQISAALSAELEETNCPIKVIDGPESTTETTPARERIVIEEDDETGDTFAAPHNPMKNPRARMICMVPAKITIFAKSPNAASAKWEHRRRARHILDLVLVALDNVLRSQKQGYRLGRGGFQPLADFESSETPSGAKYVLTLSIERGVFEQTWKGEKKPEAVLGEGPGAVSIVNTVRASLDGENFETVIPDEE